MLGVQAEGAKLVLVYAIGRMCHIAFGEPTLAGRLFFLKELAGPLVAECN